MIWVRWDMVTDQDNSSGLIQSYTQHMTRGRRPTSTVGGRNRGNYQTPHIHVDLSRKLPAESSGKRATAGGSEADAAVHLFSGKQATWCIVGWTTRETGLGLMQCSTCHGGRIPYSLECRVQSGLFFHAYGMLCFEVNVYVAERARFIAICFFPFEIHSAPCRFQVFSCFQRPLPPSFLLVCQRPRHRAVSSKRPLSLCHLCHNLLFGTTAVVLSRCSFIFSSLSVSLRRKFLVFLSLWRVLLSLRLFLRACLYPLLSAQRA